VKQRHVEGARLNAIETFKSLNISVGQDFFTLSFSQVDRLLEEADRVRYQKPKFANGSRARYFHARLQRQARMGDKS
jgi:hypothetical protein